MRPEDDTRIADLVRVLAKVAAGDLTEKPAIVESDDELSKFALAVCFMIDDLEAARVQDERRRAELEAANAGLRELSDMKTRFINTAAHELNTPLTPIRIQLHMLRGGMLGPLTERQRASVEVVGRNLERLSLLVGDVLDAARIQSEHMRLLLKPASIAALVAEAADTLRPQAQSAGVMLVVDAQQDATLQVDGRRLTQVLLNLLSNALKFTPEGGTIRIATRAEGDWLKVLVTDTGAGLTQDQRERLFLPFSQVHDPLRHEVGGTGLGLFISRGILDQHGGHLWCESEGPGRGATFAFELPLHPARAGGAVEFPGTAQAPDIAARLT